MKASIVILFLLVFTSQMNAQNLASQQENFNSAFKELRMMLNDSTQASFKRAVFISENAFVNNSMNYELFKSQITVFADLCKKIANQDILKYTESDREKVKLYAAVFRFMKDTTRFLLNKNEYFETTPYLYDFEDFFGESDWKKMFVTKLIEKQSGNCHSLPFLYKILCEELGVPAWLSMAPNHTYIKLWSRKTGWYNTELTSGYFPIDAWIMASGYIPLIAVQNRIYMDTLSAKQSIAVCLIDLAKAYQRKFREKADLKFIEACCDLALSHYPHYINAILLKAETLKDQFEKEMTATRASNPSELFSIPEKKKLFDEMESLYFKVHELGYRKMPKEMYINWLSDVKKEKNKYLNKEVQHLNGQDEIKH